MTKKELTDHEERMASAWLDQELPEAERDYMESQLVSGDEQLQGAVDNFRQVRSEFRSWFASEIENESRKVDLWSVIEKELRPQQSLRWREAVERFIQSLRESPGLGSFAAAAAALMLFVLAVYPAGKGPIQVAQRDAIEIEQLQDGLSVSEVPVMLSRREVSPDLLEKVGFARGTEGLSTRLPVPDALAVRLLSSPQLIVDNQIRRGQIPGGFRAGETDIDWIKTNKPFKLVSSSRRETPPVIWVARVSK